MEIRIKRIDKELPLPEYQTKGSAGFDIICRETIIIPPKGIGLIPGNIIVDTPEGHMLMLTLRSSTPKKKGLIKPHGVGIVDSDYCGDNDEIKIQVYNITDSDVTVERGERVAQGIFIKVDQCTWNEVDSMGTSRGGFGSTG